MKKILLIILILITTISYSQDIEYFGGDVYDIDSIGYQSASDLITLTNKVYETNKNIVFLDNYMPILDFKYDKKYHLVKPCIEKKLSEADYIIDGKIVYMRIDGEWVKFKKKKIKKNVHSN